MNLKEAGYDVIWSGNWSEDPGDGEIIAYAFREGRVLITLDKDFGELAIVYGMPHCGIIRLVGFSAREQASICMRIIPLYREELESGAIITAEPVDRGSDHTNFCFYVLSKFNYL